MIRLAAVLALSASAASAGGLAPPILMGFAVPQPVLARCPIVPGVVDGLRAQGFTRVVAEPGRDLARFSALRGDRWSVLTYDCATGAPVYQSAVAAASADLRDEGVYILEGTDVDATGAASASADASLDVAAGDSAGADASVQADATALGNARSTDASTLQRIDAIEATAGGSITDSGF